ncbi:MAG TPA: nitrous oxide-stimulated promoter family protein [Anaerolineaceae bacterium]|nr:nitrous oxide-stimulated promoter family protein [Anaerolineaceae bacterium]
MSRQSHLSNPKHPRLHRERDTVLKMIRIYCRAHHHSESVLCPDCQSLADYALKRIDHCPFGWRKPTCDRCPIHCYNLENREKIRIVMRYAGPRILFRHPWLAILHLIDGLQKPPRRI